MKEFKFIWTNEEYLLFQFWWMSLRHFDLLILIYYFGVRSNFSQEMDWCEVRGIRCQCRLFMMLCSNVLSTMKHWQFIWHIYGTRRIRSHDDSKRNFSSSNNNNNTDRKRYLEDFKFLEILCIGMWFWYCKEYRRKFTNLLFQNKEKLIFRFNFG